jgi:spore maturation protein CgeB
MNAAVATLPARVVICGGRGGSNVGQSLFDAALAMPDFAPLFCGDEIGRSNFSVVNKLAWRANRGVPFPARLGRRLMQRDVVPGSLVITTGLMHVRAPTIRALRKRGCITVHFSTDDPWNPAHRAAWHYQALREYDIVYTPRRANLDQFHELGCRSVRIMRFGFDERLFPSNTSAAPASFAADALFVGGADNERAVFFQDFIRGGGNPALVGGYWDRWPDLRQLALGHRPPADLLMLTLAAKLNIILVRHANRDGHTMRTLEAGAIGGCLLVEDTPDHRDLFGPDGERVRYFRDGNQAAILAGALLADADKRTRMATAVKLHIRHGGHSYDDRLRTMLHDASDLIGNGKRDRAA